MMGIYQLNEQDLKLATASVMMGYNRFNNENRHPCDFIILRNKGRIENIISRVKEMYPSVPVVVKRDPCAGMKDVELILLGSSIIRKEPEDVPDKPFMKKIQLEVVGYTTENISYSFNLFNEEDDKRVSDDMGVFYTDANNRKSINEVYTEAGIELPDDKKIPIPLDEQLYNYRLFGIWLMKEFLKNEYVGQPAACIMKSNIEEGNLNFVIGWIVNVTITIEQVAEIRNKFYDFAGITYFEQDGEGGSYSTLTVQKFAEVKDTFDSIFSA